LCLTGKDTGAGVKGAGLVGTSAAMVMLDEGAMEASVSIDISWSALVNEGGTGGAAGGEKSLFAWLNSVG
jgi:hypothetical protein